MILVVSGLIGGGIFLLLWRIAPLLFGALLGLVIAAFVVNLPALSSASSPIRISVLVGLILIGALIGWAAQKPVLIISTAVMGSYLLFVGTDFFVKTGFGLLLYNLRKKAPITMNFPIGLMLGGFVLVAIIGAAVQFYIDKKGSETKYVPAPNKVV